MQDSSSFSTPPQPLAPLVGCYQNITDVARSALDSAWHEAETDTAARVGAYPSPPMSGSPHSQKAASEASERPQLLTGYPTTLPQDAYRGGSSRPSPTESQHPQGFPPPQDAFLRHHPHEAPDRLAHGYQPGAEYPSRPLSFPSQGLPSAQPYLPSTGAQSASGFSVTNRPPNAEAQSFSTSPKSQRKAKGHVASACVPCKRAHLRCDAQRPCSRCRSNGKEDACVDVQHKKRGRPRLRDDRDARYDMSRPQAAQEAARRPLSIYPGYDTSQQQPQPFRALKPNSSEPIAPRYMERGRDSGAYGQPLSIVTQPPPEPVAYLTLDLEFANASETFVDALGGVLNRRGLDEVVVPGEREKVAGLRNSMLQEQKAREPNYLPPIMGRGDHVLQGMGFSVSEVSRFRLDRQEYLTFVTAEGQPRVYPVRLGLQKEGSFYFVVLVLAIQPRPAYPISPHERSGPPGVYGQPSTPAYPPPPPGSMSHDLSRHRLSEGMLPQRPPHGAPVHSPGGISPIGPPHSYSASSRGSEYPGPPPAYQTPRSEMSSGSQSQGPRPSSYQLPPIRPPPEREESSSGSGDRSSRVDIGGLIEKPEGPGRMH